MQKNSSWSSEGPNSVQYFIRNALKNQIYETCLNSLLGHLLLALSYVFINFKNNNNYYKKAIIMTINQQMKILWLINFL